jgi:hypothetical protein
MLPSFEKIYMQFGQTSDNSDRYTRSSLSKYVDLYIIPTVTINWLYMDSISWFSKFSPICICVNKITLQFDPLRPRTTCFNTSKLCTLTTERSSVYHTLLAISSYLQSIYRTHRKCIVSKSQRRVFHSVQGNNRENLRARKNLECYFRPQHLVVYAWYPSRI